MSELNSIAGHAHEPSVKAPVKEPSRSSREHALAGGGADTKDVADPDVAVPDRQPDHQPDHQPAHQPDKSLMPSCIAQTCHRRCGPLLCIHTGESPRVGRRLRTHRSVESCQH